MELFAKTDMSVSLFNFRKLLKTLLFHWHIRDTWTLFSQ